MVREGFEAALIVAIVFAYLRRIGRADLGRAAWGGVGAAVALSVVVGVVIHLTLGNLVGPLASGPSPSSRSPPSPCSRG